MKKLSPDTKLILAGVGAIVTLVLALVDFLPMVLREVMIVLALLLSVLYIYLFYKNPENRKYRRKLPKDEEK